MSQISVICANDLMEVAFPLGISKGVIEQHRLRIRDEMNKRYPDGNVYVHVHTVQLFGTEKENNQ